MVESKNYLIRITNIICIFNTSNSSYKISNNLQLDDIPVAFIFITYLLLIFIKKINKFYF